MQRMLLDAVLNLPQILPLHGRLVPIAELYTAVSKKKLILFFEFVPPFTLKSFSFRSKQAKAIMLKNLCQPFRLLLACLALASAALAVNAPALAQAEPTMNQIYQAAQSGKLDQAQTMVQQVLILHPNSAKAHYVQAELFARQGLGQKGREALAMADKLAPGLPFAKPDAVNALRTQLSPTSGVAATTKQSFGMDTPATATSSVSPALLLILGAGVVGLVVWLIRRKPEAPVNYSAPANIAAATSAGSGGIGSGLNGPQTFGSGVAPAYGQPAYGQPGYGQPGYGQQPAGMGMGGRVMGGLATGLAVGAGVMAAQAIGKNLMGNDERSSNNGAGHLNDNAGNRLEPLPGNADMGGQNFGMNDNAGWDDAGSADAGGGDWDS